MNYTDKDIQGILSKTSYTGIVILYALAKSLNKKMGFDFTEFMNGELKSTEDYNYGFIVAFNAVGLLDYNFNNNIMTMTSMNEHILTGLKKEIDFRSKKRPDLKDTIEIIDNYFTE